MDSHRLLLEHGAAEHGVTLEDYVAWSWSASTNTLGAHHSAARDRIAISWLSEAVRTAARPVSVLDVGCSYGHHIFKLNAALDKPADVRLMGVDLHAAAIEYASAFSMSVPGFANCCFEVADVSSGLPFADSTFAAVNLADVIEHLDDPPGVLRELRRVTLPGGTLIIATPLRDSLFKRVAHVANRISRGKLNRRYYGGKGTQLDRHGEPVMETSAGKAHVSEMTLPELRAIGEKSGWRVADQRLMQVMSGSAWFDEHPVLLATLLLVEAAHAKLQRPSWAHSVMLRLTAV